MLAHIFATRLKQENSFPFVSGTCTSITDRSKGQIPVTLKLDITFDIVIALCHEVRLVSVLVE